MMKRTLENAIPNHQALSPESIRLEKISLVGCPFFFGVVKGIVPKSSSFLFMLLASVVSFGEDTTGCTTKERSPFLYFGDLAKKKNKDQTNQ